MKTGVRFETKAEITINQHCFNAEKEAVVVEVNNNEVSINGKKVAESIMDDEHQEINITVNGNVTNLSVADAPVNIKGNVHSLRSSSGEVHVDGTVGGIYTTSGDVSVRGHVTGDINAQDGEVTTT